MFEKHMIMLDRVSRSYIKNTYIYVCIYTVRVPPSCELVGFEPHLTIYRYITQKPDKYCSEVNKPKLSNGGPTIHVDIYIYIYLDLSNIQKNGNNTKTNGLKHHLSWRVWVLAYHVLT